MANMDFLRMVVFSILISSSFGEYVPSMTDHMCEFHYADIATNGCGGNYCWFDFIIEPGNREFYVRVNVTFLSHTMANITLSEPYREMSVSISRLMHTYTDERLVYDMFCEGTSCNAQVLIKRGEVAITRNGANSYKTVFNPLIWLNNKKEGCGPSKTFELNVNKDVLDLKLVEKKEEIWCQEFERGDWAYIIRKRDKSYYYTMKNGYKFIT